MKPLQEYIYALQAVLKTSVDRIFLCTPDGKFICANEAFCKFTKKQNVELKKINVDKLLGKSVWKDLTSQLNENLYIDQPIRYSSGSSKKTRTFAFNLFLEGVHEAIVFVLPVISKQDATTMKNYLSDNFMKALNGRSDSAWFVADMRRGKYLFAGEGYTRILGWPSDFFKIGGGAFFISLIHPTDNKEVMDHYSEWLLMKQKLGPLYENVTFTHTFRMKNSTGKYLAIETETNILQIDSNTGTIFLLGSYTPIPESRLAKADNNESFGNIRLIDGKSYIDIDHVRDLGLKLTSAPTENKFKHLSSREQEILKLIVDGLSSEEISENLFISIHTVNMHRKQILKKLGAKNLAELIRVYYTS